MFFSGILFYMQMISHGIIFDEKYADSFLKELYLPYRKYWLYDIVLYYGGLYKAKAGFKAYKKSYIKLSDLVKYIEDDKFILEHLAKYIQIKFRIDANSSYYDAQTLLWQSEMFSPIYFLNNILEYCKTNNVRIVYDVEIKNNIKITRNQLIDLYGADDWMYDIRLTCNKEDITIKKEEVKNIFSIAHSLLSTKIGNYVVTKNDLGLDVEYFEYDGRIMRTTEMLETLVMECESLLNELMSSKYSDCYEKITKQTYINPNTIADYIVGYARFHLNNIFY